MSKSQLESFYLDPKRGPQSALCPFCGGTLVLGYRKDNGNLSLGHTAFADPTQKGAFISGCERFRVLSTTNMRELLRLLSGAHVRWTPIVE